jgi:hypothetical protein
LKKRPCIFRILRGRKKMKRVKKDSEREGEKHELNKSTMQILKEPYFYAMVFLWLFAFCLAVYAVLIGAIYPY